jgi:hypothetical protein
LPSCAWLRLFVGVDRAQQTLAVEARAVHKQAFTCFSLTSDQTMVLLLWRSIRLA